MNVVSLVALQVQKDGNNYHLLVPMQTPFDVIREVLDEMKVQLDALQQDKPSDEPSQSQEPAQYEAPVQEQGAE